MKEKLVVLLGPTATGKTRAGVALAKRMGTEIISGDSMLVYKGLDIGTAKPNREERQGVKHHLIDIADPLDDFSAAAFQQQAAKIISELNRAGKIPLVVGGTGLYIKSLLEGYIFSAVRGESEVRRELAVFTEKFGTPALWERLNKINAEAARAIHPNNRHRLIRALEVALAGETVSREKQPELVYDALVFGLTAERGTLYERINDRVEEMFQEGLAEEAARLLVNGIPKEAKCLQGIGYKETVRYLSGEISRQECINLTKRNTRRFAKRQLTWYRSMPYINWFDVAKDTDWQQLVDDIYTKLVKNFKLR